MQVGETYELAWRWPHRLTATIVELTQDHIVADAVHRCPITCYLQQMRNTLPLDGTVRYDYRFFSDVFVRVPEGAIPLGPAQ